MAKYRGRKIAGVSIANPRRIMKKVARARAYASLHCSDGSSSLLIYKYTLGPTKNISLVEHDVVLLAKQNRQWRGLKYIYSR